MRQLKTLLTVLLVGSLITTPILAKSRHKIKLSSNNVLQKVQTVINNNYKIPIIKLVSQPQNVMCTALAVYKEARGISEREQSLVALTILNREKVSNQTACQVIAQNGQFPWVKHLAKSWRATDIVAWFNSQKVALLTRYTNFYTKPACFIRFFSRGLYPQHRRNLQCVIHLPGHYYYNLRSI